jgi:hypothetical protein
MLQKCEEKRSRMKKVWKNLMSSKSMIKCENWKLSYKMKKEELFFGRNKLKTEDRQNSRVDQ